MHRFALSVFLVLEIARAGEHVARIEVYAANRAKQDIPRTIYGTFLEPIGKSIYQGLWAQLLENPSFERGLWSYRYLRREIERQPALERASSMGLPFPWESLDYDQGMRYELRWGDAANSSNALLVMALPAKETGVRQQIYLPIHRILRYTGSFYARRVSGPPEVTISLRGRNQPHQVLASTSKVVKGEHWERYEFMLELKPGQVAPLDPVDFVISLRNGSRVLFDQVFFFPADHLNGMDPEMIAFARKLNTPLVRFGGNFTSGYHWRDGIGPMDKRISMLNLAWGMAEYNHFGTDELLRFCQLIGAEPQIALNLGSGTPEEAAGWVRYVNDRWRDQRGGLLWELGNELWGTFQIGYPTLERVASKTAEFAAAVRQVDPRARLIATGQDPDRFHDWNAAQLALPPGTFAFLSTHFVVGTASVRRSNPDPDFFVQSALALPVGLERRLREMKAQVDENPAARERVKIAFTEWLFAGPNESVPRFTNMGGALITAGFLNTLMRVSDFTPVANMTGLIEFGGIWKKRGRVYATPSYWAFRMYSTADAKRLVETRSTVDKYDITEGNNRIPEIRDVPYLDVVTAVNGTSSRLTLFCVNRHLNRDITAHVALIGFRPRSQARVQVLKAKSIHEVNDETQPDCIRPVEKTMQVAHSEFDYTFPCASVTAIELSSY